jgi:hypothetical protein
MMVNLAGWRVQAQILAQGVARLQTVMRAVAAQPQVETATSEANRTGTAKSLVVGSYWTIHIQI